MSQPGVGILHRGRLSLPILGLLSISLGLFVLYLHYYPVGFFGDDAIYLTAARSLLQGRYRFLFLPGQPPNNLYPPGYPALLAPFMALFGTHWSLYPWLSVFWTLGFCYLTWFFFDVKGGSGWALWALVAFNPLTALYSGTVMTDPAYTLFVVGVFLAAWSVYKNPQDGIRTITLGLLLGWASLIRLPGICLLVAVVAGFFYQRLWRTGVRVLGIALLIWVGPIIRNYWLTHTATSYLGVWQSGLPLLEHPAYLIRLLWDMLGRIFCDSLLGLLDASTLPGMPWVRAIAVLTGIPLGVMGFKHFCRRRKVSPGLGLSMGMFLVLHVIVHAVWIGFDYRFVLPILPLVILFCFEGAESVIPQRTARLVLLGCFLFLYGRWHVRTLPQVGTQTLPMESYRWIQEQTKPGELIAMARPPTLYLYTGRQAMPPPLLESPDLFHYWLLKKPIAYVVYEESSYMTPVRSEMWSHYHAWLTQHPQLCPLVYTNAKEGVFVYRVREDPAFLHAYESRLFTSPS